MAAGMAALIGYFKCSSSESSNTPTASRAALPPAPNPMDQAPPPPPEKSAEPDPSATPSASASASAGPSASAATGPRGTAPSGEGGPCAKCGEGLSNAALNSAVTSQAGLAHGCYKRALQHDAPTGNLLVKVAVGANGNVCSTTIGADTIHSQEISSCVVSKLQSRSYPKPTSGCVVLQVPIAFATK